MNIVFISSFPRSGSTLLGSLLGLHPKMRYLGEVRNSFPPNELSAFDESGLLNDQFWSSVFRQYTKNRKVITTKTGDGTPESVCFQNIRLFYECASDIATEDWLVDSSHRTREVKSHLQEMHDRICIILLKRDGRAVLNSVLKRRGNVSILKNTLIFLYKWNRFNLGVFLLMRSSRPLNVVQIQYEHLCANPIQTLNKVAEEVGIDEFKLSYFNNDIVQNFIGGSSTYGGVGKNLENISEDLSWKNELPMLARILYGIVNIPLKIK